MEINEVAIRKLMKEIIIKRRDLSKQYFNLKQDLEKLNSDVHPRCMTKSTVIVNKKNIKEVRNKNIPRNSRVIHSFERISSVIVEIVKQSNTPISNKEIYRKMIEDFQINISYSNLTCNILPKMIQKKGIPIEKAYRGYWQYKLRSR